MRPATDVRLDGRFGSAKKAGKPLGIKGDRRTRRLGRSSSHIASKSTQAPRRFVPGAWRRARTAHGACHGAVSREIRNRGDVEAWGAGQHRESDQENANLLQNPHSGLPWTIAKRSASTAEPMQRLDYNIEIRRYGFGRDLEGELVRLFEKNNRRPAKKRWTDTQVSYKTEYRRFVNLCAALKELADIGYPIKSIAKFRDKHVQALVKHWEGQGEAVGTIENKLSYLRTLAKWIGKPNMVRSGRGYSSKPDEFRRSNVAMVDKTWAGNGVDVLELLEKVRLRDSIVALQMELQMAFGMRVEEAMLFRPGKGLKEAIDRLHIHLDTGTKGGRPRDVQLDEIVQLDVLIRAASKAPSPNETLIPKKYSLQQWKDHYYYVVRGCGIKRNTEEGGLGVTCHGLRHEYLNRLFERITGKPAPVKGGVGHDPGLYDLAMQMVVERAGHSDKYKSGAYLGSPGVAARLRESAEAAAVR
ncbi:MAG: integrase domain-containing protein [Pseudomonadota bacterium]